MSGIKKVTGRRISRERGFEGLETRDIQPENGWYVLHGVIPDWIEDRGDLLPNIEMMKKYSAVAVFLDEDAINREKIIEIIGLSERDKLKRLFSNETKEIEHDPDTEAIVVPVGNGDEFVIEREGFSDIQFQVIAGDEIF